MALFLEVFIHFITIHSPKNPFINVSFMNVGDVCGKFIAMEGYKWIWFIIFN